MITWARAMVTALRARTRMPRNWASPSSVARSTTRNTARLSSQYDKNASVTVSAVSQLASSDQSPTTSSESRAAWSTMPSARTRMACSTFPKYW